MEHTLSITSLVGTDSQGRHLRSEVTAVKAETGLGPSPIGPFPEVFEGRLLDATQEQIAGFKFNPDVRAALHGMEYIFEELEQDGTFRARQRAKPRKEHA